MAAEFSKHWAAKRGGQGESSVCNCAAGTREEQGSQRGHPKYAFLSVLVFFLLFFPCFFSLLMVFF